MALKFTYNGQDITDVSILTGSLIDLKAVNTAGGNVGQLSFSFAKGGIATATNKNQGDFSLTGVAAGTDTLTVTSNQAGSGTLAVEVADPPAPPPVEPDKARFLVGGIAVTHTEVEETTQMAIELQTTLDEADFTLDFGSGHIALVSMSDGQGEDPTIYLITIEGVSVGTEQIKLTNTLTSKVEAVLGVEVTPYTEPPAPPPPPPPEPLRRGQRRFWLTNPTGVFDLNGQQHSPWDYPLLYDIDGLGAELDLTFSDYGSRRLVDSRRWEHLTITGTLLFGDNAEVAYQEFVNYAVQEPMTLSYVTGGLTTPYLIDVVFSKIGKMERIPERDTKHAPVSFEPLSMWYIDMDELIEVFAFDGIGKRYLLKRPYHYASTNLSRIMVQNNSTQDAALRIELIGNLSNPTWAIEDALGNQYGKARINGNYDYVMVDSYEVDQDIVLKQGGVIVPNPRAKQDMTVGVPRQVAVTYLYVKPGVSFLNVSGGSGFQGEVRLRFRGAHATV